MKVFVNRHRAAALLVAAALLARAVIPVGYMPAAPGSGLLFELCPEGMPAGFGGSSHHAHHHDPSSIDSQPEPDRCPIGHMLSFAFAVGDTWQLDVVDALPVTSPMLALPERGIAATAYRSRDPPA